jgi:hypothetical protein
LGDNETALLPLARDIAEAQIEVHRARAVRHTLWLKAYDDPDYDSFWRLKLRALAAPYLSSQDDVQGGIVARAVVRVLRARYRHPPNAVQRLGIALGEMADRLMAVDRYERRALSRRKFAIRVFEEATRQLNGEPATTK